MLGMRERKIIRESEKRWDKIWLRDWPKKEVLDRAYDLAEEYRRLTKELELEVFAYTAVIGRDCCMIGRADEDVAGYTTCPSLGSWQRYDEAQKEADRLNKEELGLDPKEASRIVISSARRTGKNES